MGGVIILCSFIIPRFLQYKWQWLFGLGVILVMMAIGSVSTAYRQSQSQFMFSDAAEIYRGVVMDIPQKKPQTVAYKVKLPDIDKQIICYFQPDSLNKMPVPGDEFFFKASIQPFRNAGNPDDFDYKTYMYNQGFAGSAYIVNGYWDFSGDTSTSFKLTALRWRMHILDFYRSLGFNETEYSILSALTLGYQDELSDDLKQSFRTTGTVHVLSVSGLHVGIIYAMISFLLGFLNRYPRYYWLKPSIIIVLLWMYSFITGLPPSVIRASAMLTVFCASEIFKCKSFSIHGLYIAAFFILLINPFSIFDIGFQLSFLSVLSILYLHPRLMSIVKIGNRYGRYLWQMITLSIVAQLATFPLCLYYFGTFPTYFFIANLFIVPLVSLITYAFGGIILSKLLSMLLPSFDYFLYYLPVKILQVLVEAMVESIHFFEHLPYALIENVKISFIDLVFVMSFILCILISIIYKRAKMLMLSFSIVLIFSLLHIFANIAPTENMATIYNRRNATEIRWNNTHSDYLITGKDVNVYEQINLGHKKLFIVNKDIWAEMRADKRYAVDYLLLINDNSLSLYSLTQIFQPQMVILDASLSAQTIKRLADECHKLEIPVHDVTQKGALSIIF